MDYYIVEINGTHVGIEHGSRADARRQGIRNFGGRVTSATTRPVTKEEAQHIRNMGGYVPLSLRQRFEVED